MDNELNNKQRRSSTTVLFVYAFALNGSLEARPSGQSKPWQEQE
tara:strand:+ start:1156 stop:1287 length:132 start_codon:yes stop_codon:yes gene_type:complete